MEWRGEIETIGYLLQDRHGNTEAIRGRLSSACRLKLSPCPGGGAISLLRAVFQSRRWRNDAFNWRPPSFCASLGPNIIWPDPTGTYSETLRNVTQARPSHKLDRKISLTELSVWRASSLGVHEYFLTHHHRVVQTSLKFFL